MITGDKQETAINIAISCKLILHPDQLLICNADSYDGAELSQTAYCKLSGALTSRRTIPKQHPAAPSSNRDCMERLDVQVPGTGCTSCCR